MGNARAAMLMVVSMAFFAVEDAITKLLSGHVPVPQIMATLGALGLALFWALLARQGGRLFTRALLHPGVIARNAGEVVGTLGFITAVKMTGLATASAILQALPLVIALGAALFLGERVGWRRWTAILVGLAGVLLIVRPGTGSFQPASLWALLSVAGLAVRDLATRRLPRDIASHQLSASAFGVLVPTGLALAAVTGTGTGTGLVAPSVGDMGLFLGAVGFAALGYATLILATRTGEASVIAPFRYSRLVFALILGLTFFAERPDAATLAGAALIVGSGVFAMWRELRLKARAA